MYIVYIFQSVSNMAKILGEPTSLNLNRVKVNVNVAHAQRSKAERVNE